LPSSTGDDQREHHLNAVDLSGTGNWEIVTRRNGPRLPLLRRTNFADGGTLSDDLSFVDVAVVVRIFPL
jgi:hypothetical protein